MGHANATQIPLLAVCAHESKPAVAAAATPGEDDAAARHDKELLGGPWRPTPYAAKRRETVDVFVRQR